MKRLMVLTTILGMVNFSGCSWYKFTHGETKPHISFTELPSKAQIFAWSPKNNAAVIKIS